MRVSRESSPDSGAIHVGAVRPSDRPSSPGYMYTSVYVVFGHESRGRDTTTQFSTDNSMHTHVQAMRPQSTSAVRWSSTCEARGRRQEDHANAPSSHFAHLTSGMSMHTCQWHTPHQVRPRIRYSVETLASYGTCRLPPQPPQSPCRVRRSLLHTKLLHPTVLRRRALLVAR